MRQRKKLHPEYIKAGIREGFGSLTAFELEKGLPKGSASDVLRGKSVSRTAAAIAEALGVPVTSVSPNQKHIRSKIVANNMSAKSDLHRLNNGAE